MSETAPKFPNTQVVYINYRDGTHGEFICDLVADLLYGYADSSLTTYGSARAGLTRLGDNQINLPLYPEVDSPTSTATLQIYEFACPVDPTKPLALFSNLVPDYNALYTRFSSCTNIVVTFEEADSSRIRGNQFYNNTVEFWDPAKTDPAIYGWNNLWIDMKAYFPQLEGVSSPDQLTADVAELAFAPPLAPTEIYAEGYEFPTQYKDSIYTIKMSDITANSSTVLATLAQATGGTVTPQIQEKYSRFLATQASFVASKLPWITQ